MTDKDDTKEVDTDTENENWKYDIKRLYDHEKTTKKPDYTHVEITPDTLNLDEDNYKIGEYKRDNTFFDTIAKRLKKPDNTDNQERYKRMAKAAALGDVFRHLGEFVGGRGYAPVEKRKENQRLYQILNMSEADRKEHEAKIDRYNQTMAGYEVADYDTYRKRRDALAQQRAKDKKDIDIHNSKAKNDANIANQTSRRAEAPETITKDGYKDVVVKTNSGSGGGSDKTNVVYFNDNHNVRLEMKRKEAQALVAILIRNGVFEKKETGGYLIRIIGSESWDNTNAKWQDAMNKFMDKVAAGDANAVKAYNTWIKENPHVTKQAASNNSGSQPNSTLNSTGSSANTNSGAQNNNQYNLKR
jgi:hypothetical protein